jgi:hypothetical protein
MSDFTIVNFKEIEDSAADREGIEARSLASISTPSISA